VYESMTASYEPRTLTDRHLAAVAVVLALGTWAHGSAGPVRVVVCGLVCLLCAKWSNATLGVVLVAAFLVGGVLGGRAWA